MSNYSSRICGSWGMPQRPGYSRTITFYADGRFKQTISSKGIIWSKILDTLEGDQYDGNWHIAGKTLRLNYRRLPESPLNFSIPFVGTKVPVADWMAQLVDGFKNNEFEIVSFDESDRIVFRVKRTRAQEVWSKIG